ncbi:hypothetical protein [Litorimonas sp. WD9-15]|uniref:hypothetical protein n=1 Tax=Litorimonas sp. WD9-15 TaxID=3418716 RepID=UPI003CFFD75E
MKILFLKTVATLSLISLTACQPSVDSDIAVEAERGAPDASVQAVDDAVQKDGKVRVVLQDPVSEPRACIVPIRIENGLEGDVSVTMIGFDVTGPGEDTKGNMFAPVAESGMASEARVILEGQSCDAFETITVPEVLCKEDDADCRAKIEFEDGADLSFSQAG